MRNMTVTLDDDVARWARIRAAELDTSVSRLLGDVLRQMMEDDVAYARARDQYLATPASALSRRGTAYPAREELHDRPGLR
jgi:plasmid stability protein